jgi:zinc protease
MEPEQNGPRAAHVDWPSATLPIVSVGFKVPAYNDATKPSAALDALAYLAFSNTSDLYQKLVVQEQKADAIFGNASDSVDPSLFEITARVKKPEDVDYVRDRILETVKAFQEKPVDPARLDTVRKRLRYQVALSMDNSDTIAQILSHYVALKRTPETMNALYDQYAKLTPEDVQQAAKLLLEKSRTMVTLTGPGGGK